MIWKENKKMQQWSTPSYRSEHLCSNDGDCEKVLGAPNCLLNPVTNNKVCSFVPNTNSGTCVVNTEKLCLSSSKIPYICDTKSCKIITEKQKCDNANTCKSKKCNNGFCSCSLPSDCDSNKCQDGICQTPPNTQYTEWRSDITCSDSEPCPNGLNCSSQNKCEGCRTSEDCPGASTCDSGVCTGGRCILGNWALKQWCEQPLSRCQPNDDGTYPDSCNGSSNSPGVTDIPPFAYNPKTGKCHITKKYCDYFSLGYDSPVTCKNNEDCGNNRICNMQLGEDIGICHPLTCENDNDCGGKETICSGGFCTGPTSDCYKNVGQDIGEFIYGKTIFRWFFMNHGKCNESYEPKKLPEQLNNLFRNFPEKVVVKADQQDMIRKKIIYKNYVGNINLYYIEWKDKTKGTGVDASEVYKEFPNTIFKQKDKKVVIIKKADVIKEKDPKLKKLYLTLNSLIFFDNMFVNKK
jgi:hypothetical protein